MPLTVLEVQKAKPKEKQYKLSDGQGLYLLVDTKGRKYWRMKYYFANRERVFSIGVGPVKANRIQELVSIFVDEFLS